MKELERVIHLAEEAAKTRLQQREVEDKQRRVFEEKALLAKDAEEVKKQVPHPSAATAPLDWTLASHNTSCKQPRAPPPHVD